MIRYGFGSRRFSVDSLKRMKRSRRYDVFDSSAHGSDALCRNI